MQLNHHAFVPSSVLARPAPSSSLRHSSFVSHADSLSPPSPVLLPSSSRSRSPVNMAVFTSVKKTFGNLWNLSSFFQRKDVVALPQYDIANAASRQESVAEMCDLYKWDQGAIEGASMIEGVPKGEEPQLGWIESMVPVLLRVAINTEINSMEETSTSSDSIMSRITEAAGILLAATSAGTFGPNVTEDTFKTVESIAKSKSNPDAGTISQHKELFENIKLDNVAKGNQFLEDDIFGWYRIAGPNPMRLTKVASLSAAQEMFPELTDDIVKGILGFDNDSLKDMEAENRLYHVSYPEFEGVPTGVDQGTGIQKNNYLYAPSCLLAVPKQRVNDRVTLLPLAVRCGQDKASNVMFTANRTHSDELSWIAAKTTVQVADAVIHETVYHLARTHLLTGIFICATYRTLPNTHPIHRLLKCHFTGTPFINYSATTKLINPGGTIDQITAPDIFITRGVSAAGVNGEHSLFNDWFLDVDLKNRGVLDPILPYPYRDDAIKVWVATLEWVRAYVGAYYESDADVARDTELAAWCQEITDPKKGNLHGFGEKGDGKIQTVDYLVKTVAHIIFTATAQHAAVNFPQGTLMQFAPSMPLAGYAPPLNVSDPKEQVFKSIDELSRKMFPTLDASEKQLITAELIGVCQVTTLGDYGRSLEFAPDEVSDAMEEFQAQLDVIGGEVRMRNKLERAVGLPIYKYLAPKNIPNTINV